VIAFGDTGPVARDESFEREARCRTHYERTKTEAHEIARGYQRRGLPLVIVCPHAVIGPNDHSPWGYFLRLYMAMPYLFGWSQDRIHCPVDLRDAVSGLVLAAEKGRTGETYILAGEPKTRRQHIAYWTARTGASAIRVWVPGWLATALFALPEALERAAALPAFISRETARGGAAQLNFSSEKAKRELGWTHRSAREMWFDTVDRERELLAKRRRRGLVSRLQPV
jgi:nucleoside-diphosphate-sugar epimerase